MAISAVKHDDLYQRGLAFYRAGNYERCRDCAEQALATEPRSPSYLTLKGMALTELDRPDQAIEALRQATRLAAEDAEGWRHLALALLSAGKLQEAAEAFQTVLRLRPGDVPALVDLGNVLFTLGQVEEAVAALDQARRALPGDLSILRNLGDLYVSARRPQEALQTIREILEMQPEDTLAHCDAAWLYLKLGRCDEAAAAFQRLRRIDPEHELYAVHGLVVTEIRRRSWRRALDRAIEATRLDRCELTTALLAFVSGRLFGKTGSEVSEEEVDARFESEHREHRRLHAEVPV